MLDIKITKTTHPKEKPQDESKLGFGKQFSDHMFLMDYTAGEGWHDARIVPYGPWEMDPATTVFHYAQEIFEGMKAYRTADGKIQLFRPDCNANRFNDSADRLGMPPIPPEDFVQAVKALVDVDRDWVPHSDGASLYIRPFCIATDVGLGVHAAKHYRFAIICAPSGAYYAEGLDPVRIYVEDEYIRAAPGLTGFTKCGGNYAASIKAGELAEERGFSQVLWLDGVEKKYVEETLGRYVTRLNQFYEQIQRVGNNYNQIVRAVNTHFSHTAIPRQVLLLERRTRELKALSEQVIALSRELYELWSRG